jgi:hypothetical protein
MSEVDARQIAYEAQCAHFMTVVEALKWSDPALEAKLEDCEKLYLEQHAKLKTLRATAGGVKTSHWPDNVQIAEMEAYNMVHYAKNVGSHRVAIAAMAIVAQDTDADHLARLVHNAKQGQVEKRAGMEEAIKAWEHATDEVNKSISAIEVSVSSDAIQPTKSDDDVMVTSALHQHHSVGFCFEQ